MKKNLMGIGTLILTNGIVAAYVKAIIDRVHSGLYGTKLTFKDTEDIYETLAYLLDNYDDNYEGNSTVKSFLDFAASNAKDLWESKQVVSVESDLYHSLLTLQNNVFRGIVA